MIGTERRLYEEGSGSRTRIIAYGSLVEELHVIVLTKKSDNYQQTKISHNVTLYPTQSRSKLLYPFDAAKMGAHFRGKAISLVSAQDPFESGLAAFLLSRKLGSRLHLHVHTDFLSPYFKRESVINWFRVILGRFLLKQADCIRVVSQRIVDSIMEDGIVLKQEPVVLPIYVDVDIFLRREHGTFLKRRYPQFETTILMVNRLEREKNVLLAFRAFEKIVKQFPKTGLVVVGSGSQRTRLENFVKKKNIADRIAFEGWQDNTAPYYQSATIFLSTSNYEGYGVSLVEAAASHLPIVTTDIGIARELLGEDGVFIGEVGRIDSIARELERALQDPERREGYANRAQERMKNYLLDTDEYFNRYKDAWEKCL